MARVADRSSSSRPPAARRSPQPRRSRQLGLPFRTWGGARKGAGRKPVGPKAGVSHATRPRLEATSPVHVTIRVCKDLPSLRSERCLPVLRAALSAGRRYGGFRLVHYALQPSHIHLVVEAPSKDALSRGLQGLGVRIARRLNARLGRRGRVFADRYHARALTSPRQTRHALAYVLLQHRRHGSKDGVGICSALDPCSSAYCFDGWTTSPNPRAGPWDDTVVEAKTWLLTKGWRRHGRIDPAEMPGKP